MCSPWKNQWTAASPTWPWPGSASAALSAPLSPIWLVPWACPRPPSTTTTAPRTPCCTAWSTRSWTPSTPASRTTPPRAAPARTRTARPLLGAYLAVLLAHRQVVPLIATDIAVLNHPTIGPRLRAQNHQLQSFLTGPDTSPSARLRAEAALGAIWRPLIAEPPLDLTNPTHQRTLIDAAVAALHPSRPSPNGEPIPATHTGPHGLVDAAIGSPALPTEVCDAKQELEAISE